MRKKKRLLTLLTMEAEKNEMLTLMTAINHEEEIAAMPAWGKLKAKLKILLSVPHVLSSEI
jgi:hypothetical protein